MLIEPTTTDRLPLQAKRTYTFRHPTEKDGPAIWRLISQCPPLDQNSLYFNLIQCTHFARTCLMAESDGRPYGWVSAHRLPSEPRTLFVWQVAVHRSARGSGLGRRLLTRLIRLADNSNVTRIKTSITPDNEASWALFGSMAESLDAPTSKQLWFDKKRHFDGRHDSEHLLTIGPFESPGSG